MTTLPGLTRRSASRLPLLGALALVLLGFLAVLAPGARPALGADPTMSPFVPGRHVYDYGSVLSARSATTAEALAAHIEGAGAGRVVLYTAPDTGGMPDGTAIAQSWNVDGLLLTAQSDFGQLKLGPALKAKLDSHQLDFVSGNSSPGPQTAESWLLSTLARVDAFVSGTHVFDGTGILDAAGKQKAEAAAKDLGDQIGANVYIDIAIGGNDPSTAAFFNGAGMSSDLGKSIVVALAVSDGRIGGYIDYSGDLSGSYKTSSPWSYNTLANESAPNGDVQAALLAAIGAVQKPPLIPPEAIPWIIFAVVMVIFSITAPFLWGPWLIRKLAGVSGPIKNGLPGDAVIQSISDTGMTVTMPSVGPDAPEYKFVLQVTAAGGGAPYQVETKALVPRLFVPMVVPGASIGVLIDPANPQKVALDFSRVGGARCAGEWRRRSQHHTCRPGRLRHGVRCRRPALGRRRGGAGGRREERRRTTDQGQRGPAPGDGDPRHGRDHHGPAPRQDRPRHRPIRRRGQARRSDVALHAWRSASPARHRSRRSSATACPLTRWPGSPRE